MAYPLLLFSMILDDASVQPELLPWRTVSRTPFTYISDYFLQRLYLPINFRLMISKHILYFLVFIHQKQCVFLQLL